MDKVATAREPAAVASAAAEQATTAPLPERSRFVWARAAPLADRLAVLVWVVYVVAVAVLFLRHDALLAHNEFDSVYYIHGARHLATFDDRFHGPGYPAAIRAATWLAGDGFAAAKLVAALSAVGTALLLWRWARQVAGPPGGLVAVAFWAATADVLVYSVLAVSDMLALLLLGLTLAVLSRADRQPVAAALLAGALAGLTYLTRYANGTVAVAVGLAFLLWPQAGTVWRGRAGRVALFLLAFVAVGLPWFWRLTVWHGSPFWNDNYLNIAFKAYEGRQWGAFPTRDDFPGLLSVVAYAPLTFVQSWWGTLYQLPTYLAGRFAWAGLCVLPGLVMLLRQPQRSTMLALAAAALYVPLVALTWLEPRLLLPLYPVALVALAATLTSSAVPDRVTVGRIRLPVRALFALLLLASLFYRVTWQVDVFLADEAPEYRTAGAAIAQQSDAGDAVLAAAPHIALYADRPILTFGDWLAGADADNLSGRLAEIPARYVVFDARFGAGQFPHLAFLLSPDAPDVPANLRHLTTVGGPQPVVIYEVVR